VTFVDNHDSFWQPNGRFAKDGTDDQAIAAIGFLLCTLGTACIYYGTEQGFVGQGGDNEMREAMFDKTPGGKSLLNTVCRIYQEISKITEVTRAHEPLRFGRMYYRQISDDGEALRLSLRFHLYARVFKIALSPRNFGCLQRFERSA